MPRLCGSRDLGVRCSWTFRAVSPHPRVDRGKKKGRGIVPRSYPLRVVRVYGLVVNNQVLGWLPVTLGFGSG